MLFHESRVETLKIVCMIKRNACLKFLIFDFEQILVRNGWASSGTSPSPVVDVTITDTVCKASDNLSPLKINGSLMDCKETQLKRCSLSSACDAIRLAIGQVGSPTWLFSELKKLSLPCPMPSHVIPQVFGVIPQVCGVPWFDPGFLSLTPAVFIRAVVFQKCQVRKRSQ